MAVFRFVPGWVLGIMLSGDNPDRPWSRWAGVLGGHQSIDSALVPDCDVLSFQQGLVIARSLVTLAKSCCFGKAFFLFTKTKHVLYKTPHTYLR